MNYIEEVPLGNQFKTNEIIDFLDLFNLQYEYDIDFTIAIYDEGKVIATASKAINVLKCFAIDPNYQGLGLTNALLKTIEDRMFKEGLYHFFIYTKEGQKEKFIQSGYQEIITTSGVSLLENGEKSIHTFLTKQKEAHHLTSNPKACIVMNGNPFTRGHRYLIEKVAKDNEEVLVFVVSEDHSVFPFDVRYRLIKEGVKDLENVTVLVTGPYLVSHSTFPAYFLKKEDDALQIQTMLDTSIFGTYFKDIFNIHKRVIGTEPNCTVTNQYNQTMLEMLPSYGVNIEVIERLQNNHEVISASKVRQMIHEGKLMELLDWVPKVTYNYLVSNEASTIIDILKENMG